MSDTPNSKKLNEDQMDQLLSSFYKQEVPPELGNLPSTWPELQALAGNSTGPVATVIATPVSRQKETSSAGRAIAVIASLAACMLLVTLTNTGDNPGTQVNNTMPVSGNSQMESGIVDPDVETTMEEVEGFQFETDETESDSVAEPKTETEN